MDIRLRDLRKVYSTRTGERVVALEGVSAEIDSGEFVSLVGPSGCGKSTLLDVVSGLTQCSGGEVSIDGRSVSDGGAGSRVGLIFQKPVLLPWRTALENVYLPAQLGREPEGRTRGGELRQRARELIELVDLGPFAEKYPWELSGGMQQRVAIARALLLEARVMCMDEPFAALDEFTREQMHLELLNVWQAQGFTALFVTHNIFEAVFLSDRVLVMTPRPGRVVADVEVDLPRPRTSEMIGSDLFGENIRKVRGAMREHWVV